jgi:transcriptional regulator with XRE-family HTH domain
VTVLAPVSPAWSELREARGLTVRDLADLTGLDSATIEKLELGGRVTESTRRLVLVALREPDVFRAAIA